ncbi:unnamed protein product [Penicillium camemberti]|uniref:Str. FM013 n=1 Tax=Penicillium camemberti (strain FM 013) TaxID=1429867 RepID=A0A0G4P4S4_PENC3|nr:unnamed protein product [Penicillium camemberti]
MPECKLRLTSEPRAHVGMSLRQTAIRIPALILPLPRGNGNHGRPMSIV